MEKGASRQKEGLRGRDSSEGPSKGPGSPQKESRRQLTEKGPISGAMEPISGARGPGSPQKEPRRQLTEKGPISGARGPGVAPGPPSDGDSCLQRMLGLVLKASGLRVYLTEATPVTVLLLQRYMAGGSPCPSSYCYCYDVTVTDGTYQEKCFLAPKLNGLVQRNALGAGRQIKITRCSYLYNEKSLSSGFVCIEELEILEGVSGFAGLPSQLRICHVKSTLPLKGGRKHYLPMWNNDDPFGDMWVARKPLREVSLEGFKSTPISIVALTWEAKRYFPPLRVRIIHKSRLRYFGKPQTNLDVPYQAYFDVADQSGMVLMVLWGSLCPEWYHSMKIGTVLLLEKYVVKRSLSSKIQSSPEDLHMKRFSSIEIALNVRDPPAKINIIPEHKVKPEWKLPKVEYQFVTRSELDKLAQNQFCDIIGLVQYVGRVERKKKKGYVDDFWTYRWVHVVDGTSDNPFLIELFSTSQPDIFEQIYPMTYLVCTQMRVEKNISENGSSTTYLTTSMKTQIFISGWHKDQPYIKYPEVQDFIRWMKTQDEASYADKVAIGGYHRFPPLPPTFAEYCKDTNEELVLISISEIEKEIGSFHYREQKHIAFQGIISAIRCVSCSSTSQDASGESPMQIEESSSVGTSLSEQQQARESTSRQKSPSPEQQTIATRSCVKRRISALEIMDHTPGCSQHSYFTRSTSKRRMLPNFSQDNSDADEDNEEVVEVEQTHKSNKEAADGSEEARPQGMCPNSWESVLWDSVRDNLAQHLNFSKVFPESFPCKFSYAHKECLLKQCNLQAAKLQPEKCPVSGEMSHFEKACPPEYYQVTILGINHNIAIEVPLLNDSYLFQVEKASQNTAPPHGSGTTPCRETINRGGLFELLSLPDDFKAVALENQRVICILDVCPLDNDKTEVFLRKIYKIAEVDVANQT